MTILNILCKKAKSQSLSFQVKICCVYMLSKVSPRGLYVLLVNVCLKLWKQNQVTFVLGYFSFVCSLFGSIYNQDSNKVLLQYKLFFRLYFVITKMSTACIGCRYHCQILLTDRENNFNILQTSKPKYKHKLSKSSDKAFVTRN